MFAQIGFGEIFALAMGVLFVLICLGGAVRVFLAAIWGKPPPYVRAKQAIEDDEGEQADAHPTIHDP